LTALSAAALLLTGERYVHVDEKPSFSKRTSSPSCSVVGPTEARTRSSGSWPEGAGRAAGEAAALTVKNVWAFGPLPFTWHKGKILARLQVGLGFAGLAGRHFRVKDDGPVLARVVGVRRCTLLRQEAFDFRDGDSWLDENRMALLP